MAHEVWGPFQDVLQPGLSPRRVSSCAAPQAPTVSALPVARSLVTTVTLVSRREVSWALRLSDRFFMLAKKKRSHPTKQLFLSSAAPPRRRLWRGRRKHQFWSRGTRIFWHQGSGIRLFSKICSKEISSLSKLCREKEYRRETSPSHVASTVVGRLARFPARVSFALEPSYVVEKSQEC